MAALTVPSRCGTAARTIWNHFRVLDAAYGGGIGLQRGAFYAEPISSEIEGTGRASRQAKACCPIIGQVRRHPLMFASYAPFFIVLREPPRGS